MEPYKPKKLPFVYDVNFELLKLVCEAEEMYGEYKGHLKSMSYDYKSFLECSFINDTYYSFKIDGAKISKEYMFYTPYMNNNNDVIEFNNFKKALLIGITDITKGEFSINTLNKINKTLFLNCKKTNTTKGSGKFRKTQNFILKPGLAGSSVAFIPPVYTELKETMNNLIDYINHNDDISIVSSIIIHYQFKFSTDDGISKYYEDIKDI